MTLLGLQGIQEGHCTGGDVRHPIHEEGGDGGSQTETDHPPEKDSSELVIISQR